MADRNTLRNIAEELADFLDTELDAYADATHCETSTELTDHIFACWELIQKLDSEPMPYISNYIGDEDLGRIADDLIAEVRS